MSDYTRAIDHSDLPPVEKQRALALIEGYVSQWKDYQPEVVEVEREFRVPILGTGGRWEYVGKIDLLCRDEDGLILIEHKTKTGDVNKPHDPYYRKLDFDAQLSGYHLAQFAMGDPVVRTIYDVTRKIASRPKVIPKGSEGALGTRSEIETFGSYYGVETLQKAAEGLTKEDDGLYGMRVAHEVSSDPEKYFFQYATTGRTKEQLVDTMGQLAHICLDIEYAEADGSWYQNTSNCLSYGSVCEYFDLCMGISQPDDPAKWQPRKGTGLSGNRTLSHSRATCWQSCRRKAYWRYREKIEPIKPDSPALRFGRVFHLAQEAYWNWRKRCQQPHQKRKQDSKDS